PTRHAEIMPWGLQRFRQGFVHLLVQKLCLFSPDNTIVLQQFTRQMQCCSM
ncbi:hypothetical protein NDU88_002806, partial [Pleurodeles waltl]